MTVVAIHQPQYLPWVPYCAKAAAADVFVYLDNVQYEKNGLQNRNRIKTASGVAWLTVPVSASLGDTIARTRIAGHAWREKHLRTIEQNYGRAAGFARFAPGLRALLEQDWEYLADLNIAVTEWMLHCLEIRCRRVRASELDVVGAKQELVLSICKAVGATTYLSGPGAKAYQVESDFIDAGIDLRYQDYSSQPYAQRFPAIGFVPDLSALDLMLNRGCDAKQILISGEGTP